MLSTIARQNVFKKEGINISNHAKKRLSERITQDEYKHFVIVRDAFLNGKAITTFEKTKSRYLWNNFMFVFCWNNLLTVYKLGSK